MVKLNDIIGHTSQLQQLQSDRESENVSHAYLFSGPRHLGKFSVALNFARDLLEAEDSAIERLLHPDLLVLDQLWMEGECEDWDTIAKSSNVQQEHRKKKATKTDTISIDDIRILQERLFETGTGTYRCCLIRSIERMNDPAANAFLKILEEPPEGLVFLLTTEAQSTLLPTIISRTRVMPFLRISNTEIMKMLQDASEDDRAFIYRIAEGAPGMVMRLVEDPELLREQRTVHTTAQSFWRAQSLRERLQILSPLSKRGKEADALLLHLGLALRQQSPALRKHHTDSYVRFVFNLSTNAHRQLMAQDFALQIS